MTPPRRSGLLLGALLPLLACGGGDALGPSKPQYFTVVRDGPCDGPTPPADTLMQPHGVPPNAGSGYIDSYGPADRPPRTVFWVIGYSSLRTSVGQLTFILVRTPNPPPAATYPVEAPDSTVWLEEYTPTYRYDGVPFDMAETGFVTEPFTGSVQIEQSDSSGMVGTFTTTGRYRYDGVVHCMSASAARFSTRLR